MLLKGIQKAVRKGAISLHLAAVYKSLWIFSFCDQGLCVWPIVSSHGIPSFSLGTVPELLWYL